MNDFDNVTGLPATRRQFLVTTERQGDEKILGRLIEKNPSSKSKRSEWGMQRAHRDMHQQNRSGKTNFLSIFYQNLIQHWRPGICTWHLFKLGLLCFLTMLAFEPGRCNSKGAEKKKREDNAFLHGKHLLCYLSWNILPSHDTIWVMAAQLMTTQALRRMEETTSNTVHRLSLPTYAYIDSQHKRHNWWIKFAEGCDGASNPSRIDCKTF